MKAGIVTRLDKLNRRVRPTWRDLTALILIAGERMNQAELEAFLAFIRGSETAKQKATWDEWLERNLPRIWAVWDEKHPGWQDAPFWLATDDNGEDDDDACE
jgi:hypothetical protein